MEATQPQRLLEIVNKGGFEFRLIKRTDNLPHGKNVAMYGQYEESLGVWRLIAIEVFTIRTDKAGIVFDKPVPFREHFPSDQEVGKLGYSFHGENKDIRAEAEYEKRVNENSKIID